MYQNNRDQTEPEVLIVDDEPFNIELVTLILGEQNITIDSALSGMEALEKVKKRIALV